MSWFKLTDEERAEWRKSPATQAFLAELLTQITDGRREIAEVMYIADEDDANRARSLAGAITGLEKAIDIAGSDDQ